MAARELESAQPSHRARAFNPNDFRTLLFGMGQGFRAALSLTTSRLLCELKSVEFVAAKLLIYKDPEHRSKSVEALPFHVVQGRVPH